MRILHGKHAFEGAAVTVTLRLPPVVSFRVAGRIVSAADFARQVAPVPVMIDGKRVRPAPVGVLPIHFEPVRHFGDRPLFVPLKQQFFEAFERGEKAEEFRLYGARWNEITCCVGRPVVLALGYGPRRLRGEVVSFRREMNPATLPGWTDCYGWRIREAACIGIRILERPPAPEMARQASPATIADSDAAAGMPRAGNAGSDAAAWSQRHF